MALWCGSGAALVVAFWLLPFDPFDSFLLPIFVITLGVSWVAIGVVLLIVTLVQTVLAVRRSTNFKRHGLCLLFLLASLLLFFPAISVPTFLVALRDSALSPSVAGLPTEISPGGRFEAEVRKYSRGGAIFGSSYEIYLVPTDGAEPAALIWRSDRVYPSQLSWQSAELLIGVDRTSAHWHAKSIECRNEYGTTPRVVDRQTEQPIELAPRFHVLEFLLGFEPEPSCQTAVALSLDRLPHCSSGHRVRTIVARCAELGLPFPRRMNRL